MAKAERIWLMEYRCPDAHTILAVGYRRSKHTPVNVKRHLRDKMKEMKLNPWCGLCGSRELKLLDRPTRYRDWDQFMTAGKQEEAKNILTNVLYAKY